MMGKSGPPDEAARSFSMTAMPSVGGESPQWVWGEKPGGWGGGGWI